MSAVSTYNNMWQGNQLNPDAYKAAQAELAASKARSDAETAYWKSGGDFTRQQQQQQQQWNPYSGYGSGREYDDAASGRRVSEAQQAADIRKGETQFNYDAGDRSYQNRSNTDVGAFNQKQATMEAIAQRQKNVNTDQASSMWKTRDS